MRLARRLRGEEGHTMIAAVGATFLVTVLGGAALAAANGDLNLVRRDLDDKRAFAAAQAGLGDYSFHLNNDNGYWAKCTSVPAPHAVNQQGSTANRRFVPGATDASYAIELLPRTGQSSCNPANPVGSMLEQSGPNTGTFRIRSTGYVGDTEQSVVATFKRASLLDYVYFTQLETSDPVSYGFANPSAALNGAYSQCSKFRREGRMSQPMPSTGGQYCDQIVFVTGDQMRGPLHTNDDLLICGTPSFGRSGADVIEVSAPPQGWQGSSGCSGNQPNFVGPLVTTAPVLTPPATNGKLKTIAGPSYTYTNQTTIQLTGTTMRVNGGSPIAIPSSGVVYVKNGACSSSYSPFTATYPNSSGCGNVRVFGTYSAQLTIAAENDVIIWDDITRTGNGLLGLIANNFVRVRHPICPSNNLGCSNGAISAQTSKNNCGNGVNGTGTQSNLRIDAAMLAIQHSFIVDHYNCGNNLGNLTINGAFSQKFRGAVGTTGGNGYIKNYNYDDRLRYQEPPSFLDPVQSAWHVQRETLDFP